MNRKLKEGHSHLDLIWKRSLLIEKRRGVRVDQVAVGAKSEAGADLVGVNVFGEQLQQGGTVLLDEVVALGLQWH